MNYYKFWSFLLLLLVQGTVCLAQPCTPVYHQLYNTLCSGEALYGYTSTGIYTDTFKLSSGCDSIRILDLFVVPNVGATPSSANFNTGSNGLGDTLPRAAPDRNWKVATAFAGPYTPAIVMTVTPGNYSRSPWSDCRWISHSDSGIHSRNMSFYYKLDFDLACHDSCGRSFEVDSTFCLRLDIMVDNSVHEIYVNGKPQSTKLGGVIPVNGPYIYEGFKTPQMVTASFCSDWKKGHNSLIVEMRSGSSFAAFLAKSSTKMPAPPPPTQANFDMTIAGVEIVDSGCAPLAVTFINKSISAGSYFWDFGDGSPVSNLREPVHTFERAGVYTVTQVARNSCTSPDTLRKKITIRSPLSDTFTVAICEKESYTFNNQAYTTSGLYPAFFPRSNRCDSISNLNLMVHNLPESEYSNIHILPACLGESNGAATLLPDVTDTAINSYEWKNDQGNTLSVTANLNKIKAGNYILRIENRNGCSKEIPFTVIEEEISFNIDTLLCTGSQLSLNNTSEGQISCTWDFGDGQTATSFQPIHSYSQSGIYRVTLTGAGLGCKDTVYHTVIVDAPMKDPFFRTDPVAICTGETLLFVPETDSTTLGLGWNFDHAAWQSKPAPVQHAFDEPGSFPVTLTAKFRVCPDLTYVDTVHVYPLPKVDLGAGDTALCLQGTALTLANSYGQQTGDRHQWSTGDTTPLLKVFYPDCYSLTLTNAYGCVTTESVRVKKDCYTDIPNIFTPNGDGFNDYFFPRQLLSSGIDLFHMKIFNRWGQPVFETALAHGRGWDGRFNGKEQPAGVYIYLIEAGFENRKPGIYKGNVTLIR